MEVEARVRKTTKVQEECQESEGAVGGRGAWLQKAWHTSLGTLFVLKTHRSIVVVVALLVPCLLTVACI